ncbi:hypothetical protein AVEN_239906-1 [Araneus ventricosus]|uniref:Uncharacterized protein n=1 Tax=Araneus ventricosus TaxID=182803 RepID=A0A4Y2S5I3_ARAVE|nr:hypothetical protein AVEN_239906-1 [Araneus ventricosus]
MERRDLNLFRRACKILRRSPDLRVLKVEARHAIQELPGNLEPGGGQAGASPDIGQSVRRGPVPIFVEPGQELTQILVVGTLNAESECNGGLQVLKRQGGDLLVFRREKFELGVQSIDVRVLSAEGKANATHFPMPKDVFVGGTAREAKNLFHTLLDHFVKGGPCFFFKLRRPHGELERWVHKAQHGVHNHPWSKRRAKGN